ncbi:MAG: YitT family protein [Oscillospiraceae bacterium]|nr:YitT family protein [Oscillospiraceae bacterium]
MKKPNHPILLELYHFIIIAISAFLYSLSVRWFFMTDNIAFGGVTGVSILIHTLFGLPSVGTLIALLNIPLFLLGWRFVGRPFLIRSLYAMFLTSFFIDAIGASRSFPKMDPLLSCIYGGLLLGLSLGLIFRQGASTGGTDVAARLLKLKFSFLPMGQLMLVLDLVVISASALVFHTLNSALYGILALYISSIVMDGVLYGMNKARLAYIISNEPEKITGAITKDLSRGVTLLQGKGAFSGADKQVLLCAFKRHQIMTLKQTVKEIDPDAFLIVTEAYEVLGQGFQAYSKNDL